MRTCTLILFVAFSVSSFAADLAITMVTPERVVASGVIDDQHAFEYHPEIAILFSGWRAGGLTIAIGSDEGGRISSLVPFRLTLRSEDGVTLKRLDEPSSQSYFPAEIKAPDHMHILLPILRPPFFKVMRPGRYLLKMEVILPSSDGKDITITLPDAHITIETKKG